MNSVRVELSERSYEIFIGQGLLGHSTLFSDVIPQSAVIVTDTTVQNLYLDPLQQTLSTLGVRVGKVIIAAGETNKTLSSVESILQYLLEERYARDTVVIALGGGVVGDMAGFAAALYQRGVNFIQVPTTLLAQVDSSVGGKTGVNHPLGKNMIGAFHQPCRVVIDTDVLKTLPDREISAGLAEIVKYGLIWDEQFFDLLEAKLGCVSDFSGQEAIWAIQRSCEIKAQIVAQDERESGIRAILNLGHTFGHAFEALLGYGVWLHGEAVGLGMILAVALSVDLGLVKPQVLDRSQQLLKKLGLPVVYPAALEPEVILNAMWRDKKVMGGKLRLILLQALGQAVIRDDVERDTVLGVLARYRDQSAG